MLGPSASHWIRSRVEPDGQPKQPLWGGLKDHCIPFVTGDNAVKLLEVVGLVDGYAQLLDLECAGIADDVAGYDRLRVIAGETVVGVHGWRNVIDHVTRRDGDFEAIGIAGWFFKFDGKFPLLFGFKNSQSF